MTAETTKWALITGASPGSLGEAEALAFLARGINVFATSPDFSTTKHVRPSPGSNNAGFLIQMHLDVTSPPSVSQAADFVSQISNGRLSFLVINNAGSGYFAPLVDADLARAKREYDVNVWGALSVTRAFFPLVRAARGIVVNQASVSGVAGFSRPFLGVYSSSKAALLSLSDVMRLEFEPFGVRVVALVTGAVKTEFAEHARGACIEEGSPYFPIKEEAEKAMRASMTNEKGHDRHDVARRMVEALLVETTPMYIRDGYMGTLLWLLHLILPIWMLDSMHRSGSGLGRLKTMIISSNAEKQD